MATIVQCDLCGIESRAGQQWLRVRVEPFYPRPQASLSVEVDDYKYNEGLHAEACSTLCAVQLLAKQAAALSNSYGELAEALVDLKPI